MRRSPSPPAGLAVLAALVLSLWTSCGGEPAAVEDARLQYRLGRLEVAEQFLSGEDGPAAQRLHRRIAERRADRLVLKQEIAALGPLEPRRRKLELEKLLAGIEDPLGREWLEIAISRAVDLAAEQSATSKHTTIHPLGYRLDELEPSLIAGDPLTIIRRGEETDLVVKERPAGKETLNRVRADIKSSVGEKNWVRAWAELQMALAVSGDRVSEFRTLSDEVLCLAQLEMAELLDRAEEFDDAGDLSTARSVLHNAERRFPDLGGLAELRDRIADYDSRLSVLAAVERPAAKRRTGAARPTAPVKPDEPELVIAPGTEAETALALEREGKLGAAMDAWLEAGFAALPGAERDAYIARARALERRVQLRHEIVAARRLDPEIFAEELGILEADQDGLGLADGPCSLDLLPLNTLKKAARRVTLSSEAELGLLDERLRRGDHAGPTGALAELEKMVARGLLSSQDAWEIVARQRGETVPDGGYVFQRGGWRGKAAQDSEELAAAVAKLERRLAKAKTAERDELWESMLDAGDTALPAMERALDERWNRAVSTLQRGAALDALERLAQEREELDLRREQALDLIFDEEEYFYPYRPPECPPEKARLYWPVQQRVDELVAATREVWDRTRSVKLSAGFREALDGMAWTLECAQEIQLDLEVPAEVPVWIWAVPVELQDVSLREFAWDLQERDALRYDRTILAFNRRRWPDSKALEKEQRARNEEQRQVEITNEYRILLGRRALSWSPLVQGAARMHSDYMAATVDFGHFEKGDPERRTPFDRMRLAGYNSGVSENCHRGSGSPEGAHNGWTHSSGHHRNLLMPGHREMASAVTSGYWTQNFGVGTDFETELDSWQD